MERELVGQSPALRDALARARRAAASSYPVLICGPTGVGKEGVARFIHHHSEARSGPFVALNCSALAEGVLEAELFGVEGGVPGFTFRRPSPGKFQLADRGTLFLDEIGDLSPAAQAKLLRVVETGAFYPVCGRAELCARPRLVAAGQRPLGQLVREGAFRADLFYRLAVLEIHLPRLAERRQDIPLLAEHFRARYCPDKRFSPHARDYLAAREYPGNVRELETLIKRAGVFSESEVILPGDFGDAESLAVAGRGDPQAAVLGLFAEREALATRDLRRLLGLPRSLARRVTDELLRQGRIARVGRGCRIRYRLPG